MRIRRALLGAWVVSAMCGLGCETSDPPCGPDASADGVRDASALVDASSDGAIPPSDAGSSDAGETETDASVDAQVDVDAYVPPPVFERSVTIGIEDYVVPAGVHRLRITADGASGGDAAVLDGALCFGGDGAHVETLVDVVPGETLRVLVGRQPLPAVPGNDGCGGGGGGGTYVVRGEREPLVVAGGGGGATAYFGCIAGFDASLTTDGGDSQFGPGNARGGTAGSGGGAIEGEGGGGGGLLGDGADSSGTGGRAFVNGGAGGMGHADEGCLTHGGQGGGGGGGNDRGGGGGGYSGGASNNGGGGSFATHPGAFFTPRTERGHGYVLIEPL